MRHNRHMRFEIVKTLKDEEFKRSAGVSRVMFEKMLAVLQKEMRDFGRPPKLGRGDQLLMTLMYWRATVEKEMPNEITFFEIDQT